MWLGMEESHGLGETLCANSRNETGIETPPSGERSEIPNKPNSSGCGARLIQLSQKEYLKKQGDSGIDMMSRVGMANSFKYIKVVIYL